MRLTIIPLLFALAAGSASADWKPLFNGKDLAGWSGDPRLWKVENGVIIGETNDSDKKIAANSFLIWQGGEPADFELEYQARVTGNNSGLQYRSKVFDAAAWIVGGYQMDLHPNQPYLGMLYEERGRGIACLRGQRVKLADKPEVTGKLDVPAIKLEEWNTYRIIARGNLLQHFVNGQLAADITDVEPAKRAAKGVIAIQVHAGPAMKAEFKELRIQESAAAAPAQPWTPEAANAWYAKQPWLVGANFVPASAISQLEMWQAETFDPERIDLELGWAAKLGFNTMRVFLHDIPWQQDSAAYLARIERFLEISASHGIRPMFVFFDSVWHPLPKPGKQPAPRPHVHNSGWVQSPGAEILQDPARHDSLKPYVVGVISRFRADNRVLAWDLFNEPCNDNAGRFTAIEAKNKVANATLLLRKTFAWAREAGPTQPLSSGIWSGDYGQPNEIQRVQLENSDIINFHAYDTLEITRAKVDKLRKWGRPIFCTEYMARPTGSTFEAILPFFAKEKIAAYNWGFVDGKSQTIYPWDSWTKAYTAEPEPWFHDIFRRDGTPYRDAEVKLIRSLAPKR